MRERHVYKDIHTEIFSVIAYKSEIVKPAHQSRAGSRIYSTAKQGNTMWPLKRMRLF